MKTFSLVWLVVSLFILPCVLDLEDVRCVLFIMLNIIVSLIFFRKYNKEFLH